MVSKEQLSTKDHIDLIEDLFPLTSLVTRVSREQLLTKRFYCLIEDLFPLAWRNLHVTKYEVLLQGTLNEL
jgi:hypothetical protein